MADYAASEIFSEVSQIFRAHIDPGRTGGTLNTKIEYEQLLEVAYITFLLHTDSIFYLALLARNSLNAKLTQEVKLVEDMLVALDDLGQVGEAVKDTISLSNANTALLALDAAQSVSNRPETKRFTYLMDQYAEQFRKNVISSTTRTLVRPREDARNILRANMQKLQVVHDQLLTGIFALRDLLDDFNSMDIPSRVASTAITNVRENIQVMADEVEAKSDIELLARSRQNLLTTLACKKSVQIITEFTDPTQIKVRSPVNPIPKTANHYGRVTGEGTPAYVLSGPGPWQLPMSDALTIKVNGETSYVVNIDTIIGAAIRGRTSEGFKIEEGHRELHVLVDKNIYSDITSVHTIADLTLPTFFQLGFKHLGVPVVMSGVDLTDPMDLMPRSLVEHRLLQTCTEIESFDSATKQAHIAGFVAGDEAGDGFTSEHVGCYFKQGDNRWEIVEVEDSDDVTLSIPDGNPEPSTGSGCDLRGQTEAAGGTKIFFLEALANAPTIDKIVSIGPAVKTVQFDLGAAKTVAELIVNIQANQGSYYIFYTNDLGPALNQHIKATPVVGDPTKLALSIRSKHNPYIQIGTSFPAPKTGPDSMGIMEDSVHDRISFLAGEKETSDLLTPVELARWVNEAADVSAEVITSEIGLGTTLQVSVDSTQVTDPNVSDFTTSVQIGDQIEIQSGFYSIGVRQILGISGSDLDLSGDSFLASEVELSYRLFREQVKISSTKSSRGSSIEVISGPSELEFPSGPAYGFILQFEAVNKVGGLLQFDNVVAGDILRVVGVGEFEITEVEGNLLHLSIGIPSNIERKSFEIRGAPAKAYNDLATTFTTYTTSPSLLKLHKFDEGVEAVDVALTTAILPGQNFISNRNQARQILVDLLSILTGSPSRLSEYTARIPTAPINLESILSSYSVCVVPAIDRLIDAFVERKYNRAVDLLRTARIVEFFETNEESGSYGGAFIEASKRVDRDLPSEPTSSFAVDERINLAVVSGVVADADKDFSDTEDGGLDIEE